MHLHMLLRPHVRMMFQVCVSAVHALAFYATLKRAMAQTFEPAHALQGRDHTIYALTEGYVKFAYNKLNKRRTVGVQLLPQQQQQQQQLALRQVRMQLP